VQKWFEKGSHCPTERELTFIDFSSVKYIDNWKNSSQLNSD
jgi:hypothetical protein